jgi:hypothetical protein
MSALVGTFFDLLVREVAMLVLLAALGSGFVALLRPDPAWGSRLALAPVFGLAVAAAVTTTAVAIMPIGTAAWAVVVPLAVASLAVAAVRLRPWRAAVSRGGLVQVGALVALVLVVSSAFNIPLAKRDTLGPIAYHAFDAPGYGTQSYEYSKHTLADLRPFSKFDFGDDRTERYVAYQVSLNQQIGYDTVASTGNVLFGFRHLSTQSAFMVAVLMVGALGAFAAVRGLARSMPLWPGLVAGVLFGGAFFFQLWMDGSQAALAGLALIGPVCLAGRRALETRALGEVVLFGILAAGLQTTYPYFVPPVVASAVVILLGWLVWAARRGRLQRFRWSRAAGLVGLVLVLALALSPIATARTAQYWRDVLKTNLAVGHGLPIFNLPFLDLPSYLLQTREFYFLPDVFHSGLQQFATGVLAPLGLLGVIGFGVWRFRWTAVLLPVAAFSALLAGYYMQRYDCSYCLQRSLLPIAPLAAVAVGVGLMALWTWDGRWRIWARALSVVAALATLLVVGHVSTVEMRRVVDGAWVDPSSLRGLLPAVARARGGPIYLEAIGQGPRAPIEMPDTYHEVNEVSPERMAFSVESNDYNGLAFLGGVRKQGREFTPEYRWVVTRVGSVRTPDRTVVARSGPYALERRKGPFDIAITSGIQVEDPRFDSRGLAWVQGPMTFWVSAESSRAAWARLTFSGPAARQTRLAGPPGGRVLSRSPRRVTFCVPVITNRPLRRLTVTLSFRQGANGPAKGGQFDEVPTPPKALRLAGMATTTRNCTR